MPDAPADHQEGRPEEAASASVMAQITTIAAFHEQVGHCVRAEVATLLEPRPRPLALVRDAAGRTG
jgi:hypothetical protein